MASMAKRIDLDVDRLRSLYVDQQLSELAVSKVFGVSRGSVRRNLQVAGIKPRGGTESMLIRMEKMTPEERKANVEAAHESLRGSVRPMSALHKFAATRELKPWISPASAGEDLMLGWFAERGLDPIIQKAVGPYNLDFAIGTVAIEVLGGNWHSYKDHDTRSRIILAEGWTMIFVWDCQYSKLEPTSMDYIVNTIDEVRRNPELAGEYRIIRGDGTFIESGRMTDAEFRLKSINKH